MAKRTSIICFLFMLCFSLNAQDDSLLLNSIKSPKKFKIGGINFEGAENSDKNVIKLLSGLKEGDEITIPGDKITDGIKALWKQGLFETIDIYEERDRRIGNTIFLVIKVVERPRLSKFKFDGVRKTDADEIRGQIRLLKERVITDYLLGSVKNTVNDHYKNKGFFFNKVEIIQEKDITTKTPHVILTIKVSKGEKVRIEKVNIIGNTVLSDGQCRRKLKESKAHHWYNPFNSGKYLEENLAGDLPSIITKYNSKGYRDARIVKDTVYFVKPDRVNIDVTIDEGHKYYFGKFKWYGNTKYRSSQLDTIVNIKPGTIYNQEKLDQKLYMNPSGFDISSLYMDDGYLFFNLIPQESNVHGDTIDYDILIYEGKQAIISKVTVKGNDKTNDHVIYREIRTRPGQLFRRSDIIRTQRELAQLTFFNPEKMNVEPHPNPADGTVDIEYTVEEKPSDQIELSGGYGGRNNSFNGGGTGVGGVGIIGTLGVTFNNFSMRNFFKKSAWQPLPSGDGQRLSVRAQTNGRYYTSFNFSFTEPWLGGKKPNAFTFAAFRSRLQDVLNKQVLGNQITNGLSVSIGTRLKKPDDYFIFQASADYYGYSLNNFGGRYYVNGNPLTDGKFNNLNFKLALSRNSVNNPTFPTSGSNVSMSVQFTPPYSLFRGKDVDYSEQTDAQKFKWLEYHKWRINMEWYTPISKSPTKPLVLKLAAKFGYLGAYNKNIGVTPFERFQLGGNGIPNNVTLFGTTILAQRGYEGPYSNEGGDPIFNKFLLELRYPFSLNPTATVYGVLFAEAANTYQSIKDYNPFKLKKSVGVGIRAILPMFGLIGIDYGVRFDNANGSSFNSTSGFFDYIGKNGNITFILGFEPE